MNKINKILEWLRFLQNKIEELTNTPAIASIQGDPGLGYWLIQSFTQSVLSDLVVETFTFSRASAYDAGDYIKLIDINNIRNTKSGQIINGSGVDFKIDFFAYTGTVGQTVTEWRVALIGLDTLPYYPVFSATPMKLEAIGLGVVTLNILNAYDVGDIVQMISTEPATLNFSKKGMVTAKNGLDLEIDFTSYQGNPGGISEWRIALTGL